MNDGKKFEQSFENSIDKEKYLVKRFNDNAASFGGSMKTRFTSTNECDYEVFNPETKILYFFELKTTLNSLTFWREDFEGKSFNIKKNQILGLQKFDKYNNTFCGLIVNFRGLDENPTFFIPIDEFIKYTSTLTKKSINFHDVMYMNSIRINSTLKRTKYSYDIEKLLDDCIKRNIGDGISFE